MLTSSEAEGLPAGDAPYSSLNSRLHQVFPKLTSGEIERVRRFSVEQHWKSGELMFQTGRPGPGMFVMLSGAVRILRRDRFGNEHLIYEHHQGQFMAEVGQLSGGPALVDGLTLTPVDALLVPPSQLRALIIAEAELGERIMRALILRRVALIEQGAGGPVLIGHSNEARLVALQGYLSRNGHPHTVLDMGSDNDARVLIQNFSAELEDLPLVMCPDGTVLRRPSDALLASTLGLLPELDASHVYDVAIVGAGPAGLATAVYAASEGLSVIVCDARAPGGQAGASARIENYLGFPTGISGQALAGRAFVQAQKFGAHIAIPIRVTELHCGERPYRLEMSCGGSIRSRSVVIASGAVYRRPAIRGLAQFDGRGVYYWASPVEARLCRHAEVALVGGGNSAGQAIVYLATQAKHVHVLIRRSGFEATMSRYLIDRIAALPNVSVHRHAEIESLEGDESGLGTIVLKAPLANGTTHLNLRHLFLFTGADPNTDWLRACHVELDPNGFVLTGSDGPSNTPGAALGSSLTTSVEGVFAIGDARAGSTKRVAAAVGEGAAVVSQIHKMLALHAGEA
jgi:thioredoxin reductase (NADPH)